ncbi:hypothetical protein [Nocardia sp. NPDC050718]|uniref:hypothetical protein n=1 Tax=unclassified Nocardia TaxID=2637762 RepID=UPI0033D65062
MNVLIEMTALCLTRPTRGAGAESLAAWYTAKARLHEHLAGLGGPDSAREHQLAASAQLRARQVAAGDRG